MNLVFRYLELPDKEKRIIVAKNEKQAKRSLVLRKIKYKDLSLDIFMTLKLNLTGKIFSEKDYLEILKIVKRYIENGRGLHEALKVAMLKPEESTSMLAGYLYEQSLRGVSLAEMLKNAKMPEYIVEAIESGERANLNIAKVLESAITFLQTEMIVKKKMKKIANSLKINLSVALTSFFAVLVFAVPELYEYGQELKPNRQLSPLLSGVVNLAFFFKHNLPVAVITYVALVLSTMIALSGNRIYSFISKIPNMKVIDVVDKRLIASYVYLIISSTTMSTIEAMKMLRNVPKLKKYRDKLNNAYIKLKSKPHVDWYQAFKIANIDKLFTAKLKTAQENIVEEVKMLIQDYDEMVEEQIVKTEATLKFFTTVIMVGVVLFLAYIVITFTYPK